jgi:hypothetical protein
MDPADNPFVGTAGAVGGIWSYGHRHPYSMSFDDAPGGTGRLFVADVGQNQFEEIDIITGGLNYGWPRTEGFHCFDPFAPNVPPASCDMTGLTPPIAEYGRTVGIAAISGYVYRGARIPALRGRYLFGDFSTAFGAPDGHLFFLNPDSPAPIFRVRLTGDQAFGLYLKGFGRDAAGEVYVLASRTLGPAGVTGVVLRIATCPADFNADGSADFFDYDDFVLCFEDPGCVGGDFNADGSIDFFDYDDFVAAFEAGC